MPIKTISSAECKRMLDSGRSIGLIDVRTPGEFRRLHAAPARLVPLDQLDANQIKSELNGSPGPLYVICQSGARAAKACERLQQAGVEQVFSIEGGTAAWERAGLPVERGAAGGVISLERQVRIAAGFLVLLGAALAWFVHPGFVALCAVIGAGLMFAGIANRCGMAMLLAKMPWNR